MTTEAELKFATSIEGLQKYVGKYVHESYGPKECFTTSRLSGLHFYEHFYTDGTPLVRQILLYKVLFDLLKCCN